MQDALRDMVRWSLGFCVIALLYLVLGNWLLRRFQKRRPVDQDAPAAPSPKSDLDATRSKK